MILIPIKFVGNIVDKVLDALWPLEVHLRSYLGMWDETSEHSGSDWLTEHEAKHEVCEP